MHTYFTISFVHILRTRMTWQGDYQAAPKDSVDC